MFELDNGVQASWGDGAGSAGSEPSVMVMDAAATSGMAGVPNLVNDSASGIHPYDSFTEIISGVLRNQYEPLTASKMFPIHNSSNPWVEKLRLTTLSGTGEAKITCGCDDKFPTVSLEGCTFETGVVSLGISYNICWQTSEQQRTTPGLTIDYEQELMNVAFRALQEKMNKLAFYGSTQHNILGLLNNPYIPTQISPYKLDDAVADPQAIVRIIQMASTANWVNSNGASSPPDTMAMPYSLLNYLRGRFANTADGGCCDTNLLQKIKQAAPHIRYIIGVPELERVGPGCDRAIFFYRRNKNDIMWHMPSELIIPPPQFVNLKKTVYLMARVGSVWPKRPDSTTLLLGV